MNTLSIFGIEYEIKLHENIDDTQVEKELFSEPKEVSKYVTYNEIDYKLVNTLPEFISLFNQGFASEINTYIINIHFLFNPIPFDIKPVTFTNCIFIKNLSNLSANNSLLAGNYLFENCIFTTHFQLSTSFDDINFKRSIFTSIEISGTKEISISFDNCHFKEKLKLRNFEYDYNDCPVGKTECKNSECISNYECQQHNKARFKELKIIDCTAEENAYLRFGFLDVDKFVLKNLRLPSGAELNIGDCRFKNFQLSNFRNIGKLKLFKINILKKQNEHEDDENFQIDNTSIGDADFQSVALAAFNKVILFDNIYHNLRYTNIDWKDNIEVGQYLDDDDLKLIKQQDTYRSLKNVALANNDTPQAIKFYAKEMDFYKQLVCKKSVHYDSNYYTFSDKATLWFNKATNNFGLDWPFPLWLLIVLSYIFFILILLSTNPNYFQVIIPNDHKYWIQLLNPLHKIEFTGDGTWSTWTYIWDFLFRIIEGLLLYQIISAFRKFSKKF